MKRNIKITPFLIFSIIVLIYAIRNHLFDFWTLRGGTSLIGVFALVAVGISIILFLVDRQLLIKFRIKKVFIIEVVLILLLLVLYQYNKRQLICDLSENVDYFVIVFEVEGQPNLSYSFPFDKKIKIQENGIYLINDRDKISNGNKILRTGLKSHSSKIYNISINDKIYRSEFITINNPNVQFDSIESKIKSLIKITLE